jgi:hypothetical protein
MISRQVYGAGGHVLDDAESVANSLLHQLLKSPARIPSIRI